MTMFAHTTNVEEAINLLKANGFIDVTESARKFYERYADKVPMFAKVVFSDPSGIGLHYCYEDDEILDLADELLWPHQMPVFVV